MKSSFEDTAQKYKDDMMKLYRQHIRNRSPEYSAQNSNNTNGNYIPNNSTTMPGRSEVPIEPPQPQQPPVTRCPGTQVIPRQDVVPANSTETNNVYVIPEQSYIGQERPMLTKSGTESEKEPLPPQPQQPPATRCPGTQVIPRQDVVPANSTATNNVYVIPEQSYMGQERPMLTKSGTEPSKEPLFPCPIKPEVSEKNNTIPVQTYFKEDQFTGYAKQRIPELAGLPEKSLDERYPIPVLPPFIAGDRTLFAQGPAPTQPEPPISAVPTQPQPIPFVQPTIPPEYKPLEEAPSSIEPESFGQLKVVTRSAKEAYPISDATVIIEKVTGDENVEGKSEILKILKTNSSGITQTIDLPAPSKKYSFIRESKIKPYSYYDIVVSSEGYYKMIYKNVPIFDGIRSIQPVDMIPIPIDARRDERIIRYVEQEPEEPLD